MESKYNQKYTDREFSPGAYLLDGEQLLWSGKPKKSAFILNQVLSMLPFALIWAFFDGTVLFFLVREARSPGNELPIGLVLFLGVFFAFHLMPVWLWLRNVLTAASAWRHTVYVMTDRRILIASGIIGFEYDSLSYKDISNVTLRVTLSDRLLGTGDIYFRSPSGDRCFLDLSEYGELYPRAQRIVLDIQSDLLYPNAQRTGDNSGYQTRYRG